MLAFALVVSLAQATPAFGAARPRECGIGASFGATNVWERAKEPHLRRYCDLLASGTSKLVGDGKLVAEVIGIAREADALLPGRAAPSVLRGRALLRLGKSNEALAALVEAKKRDERALDDPVALLAWARANARTGRRAEAAKAYRAALPRTSALPAAERSAASFEAGMIVMSEGPKGIDEAVAMLRQARRDAVEAMHVASVVALALALERAGQGDEAAAVLAERARGDASAALSDPHVARALADAGVAFEQPALEAIATQDPSRARAAWQRYLAGPGGKGPWAEHARAEAR